MGRRIEVLGTVDAYTGLKFVHVLAAIIWVGGAVSANILGTRISRTNDGDRLAVFGRDTEWLGTHVYLPASLTVLVFGILTALKGHYSFSQAWLIIGIVGIVLTSITGSAFLGPELKRIAALIETNGTNDPGVIARTKRLIVVGRIDLVVLLIVVFAMVTKPGQ
jgi:uncharacterized membrane protein